jgi:hypothetical protein
VIEYFMRSFLTDDFSLSISTCNGRGDVCKDYAFSMAFE